MGPDCRGGAPLQAGALVVQAVHGHTQVPRCCPPTGFATLAAPGADTRAAGLEHPLEGNLDALIEGLADLEQSESQTE